MVMRLGWKRGLPERHMFMYAPHLGMLGLPASIDLTSQCPPVYDQGDLGSCTANAGGALAQFVMNKMGYKQYMPSRLAIYYWTRQREGNAQEDAGASLTSTVRVLVNKGVPHESLWWYNIKKFAINPNKGVVNDAKNHLAGKQLAVQQDINHLKSCLADGFPFIFGFTVYASFLSKQVASDGICPMPKPSEQVMGGHAVTAVGYDDAKQMFMVRNSWGTNWGQKGYFLMPYSYVANNSLSDDFWTFRSYSVWK